MPIWKFKSGESIAAEDFKTDLAAYYQALENLGLDLSSYYQATDDLNLDVDLAQLVFDDAKLDLNAALQGREDLSLAVKLAVYELRNLGMSLDVNNGVVYGDLPLNLNLSDGYWRDDFKMNITLVNKVPEFRAIYAMHLISVISEVT